MSRTIYLSAVLALAAATYKLWVNPLLVIHGHGRVTESLGTAGCITVPALTACESTYTPHYSAYSRSNFCCHRNRSPPADGRDLLSLLDTGEPGPLDPRGLPAQRVWA